MAILISTSLSIAGAKGVKLDDFILSDKMNDLEDIDDDMIKVDGFMPIHKDDLEAFLN